MNWNPITWDQITWEAVGIVWFLSAILGAILARSKRRGGEGFWLGLLLGPLGILIVLGFRHPTPAKPVVLPKLICPKVAAEEADFRALIAQRGKVGISFKDRTITMVGKGSAADLAGVKVGDRLVLIDNTECKPTHREILLQLTGVVNTPVHLALRRGSQILEFTILRK